MKKLSLLILGIIIGAFATYYFCPSCSIDAEAVVAEKSIMKPTGVITPAQAKVLDTEFNSRHTLISDSIVLRSDNRSSWWSLDDMRNYLTYAENQTQGLGYTMNGVRIYLGAHPTIKGTVGYTTMFLVPTGDKTVPGGGSGFMAAGSKDILGGDGLNAGGPGDPPSANYPQ